MKIRIGFVSNSSTTSFCIYGASISKSKILKKYNPSINEEEIGYDDELDKMIEEAGLECHNIPWDGDECFIGKSWRYIKDNETGRQFKDNVSDLVEKFCKSRFVAGFFSDKIVVFTQNKQ